MKQAYVPDMGKIIYREVEKPVIEPGYIIIKVSRIGICGSDIHVFKGKHPIVKCPLVQGHEFSGYVEEIGEGVSGYKKGDLVTIQPAIGCGKCRRCKEGKFAQCENLNFIGSDRVYGGGSEYFKIQAEHALKMPENTSPDDAAMVEPLAVAVHSVSKVPDIEGEDILITGGGTIGILVAQVAREFNANNIIISEIMPARNEFVKKCGFISINPVKVESFEKELKKNLSGDYLHAAFECSGSGKALNTCIRTVSRGGYVIIVGVYESDLIEAEIVRVQDKELNLIGSLMYTWDDYHKAVELIAKNKVNLKILQTHHFNFERWIDGYKVIEEKPGEVMKVLIDLD
jgi:L-iditol 2-dehydrogenase